MSELDKLRKAFNQKCHFTESSLKEVFDDGTAMTRRICDNEYKHFIVRLETQQMPPWFPFFQKESGLNEICDYIIFVELADEVYVLLVEMKKGEESPKSQLCYTENFIKFIIRRMALHNWLRPDKPYRIRKIGLTDRPQPKNLTKMTKENFPHYDDDNYYKGYDETRFNLSKFLNMPTQARDNGEINVAQ